MVPGLLHHTCTYSIVLHRACRSSSHHARMQELEPEENWVNNGGVDYGVQLKAPSLSDITTKVLDAEATYSNWGLFNRFCLANELLDGASAAGLSWHTHVHAASTPATF